MDEEGVLICLVTGRQRSVGPVVGACRGGEPSASPAAAGSMLGDEG